MSRVVEGIRSLDRNVSGFVGIAPVRETLVGMVDRLDEAGGCRWQARLRAWGARGIDA